VLGFGVPYLYYSGLFDRFVFEMPSIESRNDSKNFPKLSLQDIDRVLDILQDFPKSERYLKHLESKVHDLKDPFFLPYEPPIRKLEVDVAPARSAVMEVPPPMKLEGIVDVGTKKLAILMIGDEKGIILSQGESWKEIRVIKIEKGSVVLSWKNQMKFLRLSEER